MGCDREHVCDALFLQPSAQRPVVPVDLIAGDPGERHRGGDGTLDHALRQLRLGRERHVRGNPGAPAAAGVAGPGLWQVQLAVDQRVPARGRVSEVDGDLCVLDPPGGAGVLPLYAGRGGALLDVSGLVGHQYRAWVAQVLDHAGPKVVAHPVSVPFRAGQEVLHPVR